MTDMQRLTVPMTPDVLRRVITQPDGDYCVDIEHSTLKNQQLLVYLTNLGISVSFHFDTPESYLALLKAYMHSPMLHDFRQLESGVLELLMQVKGYPTLSGFDYHDVIVDPANRAVIYRWLSLVESLSVFSMAFVEGVDAHTLAPTDEGVDLEGINFVKLIGHEEVTLVMAEPEVERLFYYEHFFTKQVFRGSTLSEYWTNASNVLYLITQAHNECPEKLDELEHAITQDLSELDKESNDVSTH